MENKAILTFDANVIGLAGYEYGKQIYDLQVRDKIDISQEFYIEIPSNIQFAASSFVQGFFSQIIDQIGLTQTEERAIIISENEKIKNNDFSLFFCCFHIFPFCNPYYSTQMLKFCLRLQIFKPMRKFSHGLG